MNKKNIKKQETVKIREIPYRCENIPTKYKTVEYDGKKYCVLKYYNYVKGTLNHGFSVINKEDKKILNSYRHLSKWKRTGDYLAAKCNGKNIYAHRIISKIDENAKDMNVDHINRIKNDNRRINLRIIDQTTQNINSGKRKRVMELPQNCGFKKEEIPKCIWYQKDRKRFVIEIKRFNDTVCKEVLTGSTKISVRVKLELAKKRLRYLKKIHPEWFNHSVELNDDLRLKIQNSRVDYNNIIILSGFGYDSDIDLFDLDLNNDIEFNPNELTKEEINYVNNFDVTKKVRNRTTISNLPDDCRITQDMLPKYTYYSPGNKYGDKFVIDKNNPLAKANGYGQISTSSRQDINTETKYCYLIHKLVELSGLLGVEKPEPDQTIDHPITKLYIKYYFDIQDQLLEDAKNFLKIVEKENITDPEFIRNMWFLTRN